jgi:Arc/MetJ-type ribon-helix-helix transcriptional regulator
MFGAIHPSAFTIHMDGVILPWDIQMAGTTMMTTTAAKASDTEKITINLGLIDLGQIDLLVHEGFYSNRTDFIRTAIRNHLATHAEAVRQAVVRKTLVLGLVEFTRADLEGVKKSAKRLRIQVLGLARIAPDVSVALALATIESVSVLGAFHASPAVKAALADRIH